MPRSSSNSPGRSLRDFTSPWPVARRKLPGGAQAEPAADFLQGDIVARFRAGQIQLGRGLGINDFLLTQCRQERNGDLHLSVRKGIHERLKAVAIGGHASIITSRTTSHCSLPRDASAPTLEGSGEFQPELAADKHDSAP